MPVGARTVPGLRPKIGTVPALALCGGRSRESRFEHIASQPRKSAEALVERNERQSRRVGVGGEIGVCPQARAEGAPGSEMLEGHVKTSRLLPRKPEALVFE
jgi:hypothetical protein